MLLLGIGFDPKLPAMKTPLSRKIIRLFVLSSGLLLLLTAAGKLAGSLGSSGFLDAQDPVFDIKTRELLRYVAFGEIICGSVLLHQSQKPWSATVVCWLGAMFLLYRVGRYTIVGRMTPCPCLGDVSEFFGISPLAFDRVAGVILAYFIVGGVAAMYGSNAINGTLVRRGGGT